MEEIRGTKDIKDIKESTENRENIENIEITKTTGAIRIIGTTETTDRINDTHSSEIPPTNPLDTINRSTPPLSKDSITTEKTATVQDQ